MMAREAALKEMAGCKLLRLLSRNRPFNCTGAKVGGIRRFFIKLSIAKARHVGVARW